MSITLTNVNDRIKRSCTLGQEHETSSHATDSHKRVSCAVVALNYTGKPIAQWFLHRNERRVLCIGRDAGAVNLFGGEDAIPASISRKHAEIIWENDTLQVVDLGSQNGTYFQGQDDRLEPHVRYALSDGSVLWFGHFGELGDGFDEPLVATVEFIYEGVGSVWSRFEVSREDGRSARFGLEAGRDDALSLGGSGCGPASANHAHSDPARASNFETEEAGHSRLGHAHRNARGVLNSGEGSTLDRAATESSSGTKRKRSNEDENQEEPLQVPQQDHEDDLSDDQIVAGGPMRTRSSVPAPATASVEIQTDPVHVPPPAKRSRVGDFVRGAIGGGVAVWCGLAFEGPYL
ncbi:hypothetical protein FS749_008910 [Ceratobasidium sp. UAMH 11750]|nr:hypothetical protein FS749_008910 [Ceratobasidium sp. UAMH 11750]